VKQGHQEVLLLAIPLLFRAREAVASRNPARRSECLGVAHYRSRMPFGFDRGMLNNCSYGFPTGSKEVIRRSL
jgi:hypothetical protein